MAVFVAIFLPRLSPEVFRPRWSSPTEQGCMVLERDKVIVLDQAARDAGVMVGMKRGGVTTLTADALMYDRSPARELDVQREVAFALLRSCASRLKSPCARKKPSWLMSQQVCDWSAATEGVTLTMRELDRLKVIQAVVDRILKPELGAQRLQLTVRQVERLVARYKQSGAGGVGHTSRGRPGNWKLDEAIACRALTLIRDRNADFGPTLASEKLRE
jgi:hypothetical protein